MILIIEAGTNDFIDIGLPIFFVLPLLSIICVAGSVSPINTLRKKEQKFLAPMLESVKHWSGEVGSFLPTGQAEVPQSSVPLYPNGPNLTQGPALDASKKYCSYCGGIINKDAVFCEKCGAQLSQ